MNANATIKNRQDKRRGDVGSMMESENRLEGVNERRHSRKSCIGFAHEPLVLQRNNPRRLLAIKPAHLPCGTAHPDAKSLRPNPCRHWIAKNLWIVWNWRLRTAQSRGGRCRVVREEMPEKQRIHLSVESGSAAGSNSHLLRLTSHGWSDLQQTARRALFRGQHLHGVEVHIPARIGGAEDDGGFFTRRELEGAQAVGALRKRC